MKKKRTYFEMQMLSAVLVSFAAVFLVAWLAVEIFYS